MALTPRIEYAGAQTYTSLNDFAARVTAEQRTGEIVFDAQGRLLTAARQPVAGGDIGYHLEYRLSDAAVELVATISAAGTAPVRLIVPVLARASERAEQADAHTVRIAKPKGTLTITTDATDGFETVPVERTFNLVPGFEAVPLSVVLKPGVSVRVRIAGALRA